MAGRPELLGSADSLLGHVEAWLQPVGCGIMTIHYLCAMVFNSYFQIGVKVCQCHGLTIVWLETLVCAMD